MSKHLAREDPWDTRSALTWRPLLLSHAFGWLGIRGHRNVAINPEVYQRMTPFFLKYGVHADVENHAVFANMQRPNFSQHHRVEQLFVKPSRCRRCRVRGEAQPAEVMTAAVRSSWFGLEGRLYLISRRDDKRVAMLCIACMLMPLLL